MNPNWFRFFLLMRKGGRSRYFEFIFRKCFLSPKLINLFFIKLEKILEQKKDTKTVMTLISKSFRNLQARWPSQPIRKRVQSSSLKIRQRGLAKISPDSFLKDRKNFIIFIKNHRIEVFISSHLNVLKSTVLIKSGYDVNESRNWRLPSYKY